MQVEINVGTVKEMALRLREALPDAGLSNSRSLEVTSKALGYANWDTLSGTLTRERVAPKRSAKHFGTIELYCEVCSESEFGISPDWVKVVVTDEVRRRIEALRKTCQELDLNHLAEDFTGPLTWGAKFEDVAKMNICYPRLFVSQARWWIRANPKHTSDSVESRAQFVDDFTLALDTCRRAPPTQFLVETPSGSYAFRGDSMAMMQCGNAKEFLEDILSADESMDDAD